MVSINRTSSVIIVLGILITYPFVVSLIPFLSRDVANFSSYNDGWNGASEFRSIFEEAGANVSTIVGSSNVLSRLNASETNDGSLGSLVILGPAIHYDFTESLAIMLYAINGGRVLIADDFGTANDILSVLSIFLDALSQIPMDLGENVNLFGMEIPEGVEGEEGNNDTINYPFPIAGVAINGSLLMDQKQYVTNPARPVFKGSYTEGTDSSYYLSAPLASQLLTGINNGVIGNFASILTMKVRYPNDTYRRDENGVPLPDPDNPLGGFQKLNLSEIVWQTKWVPFGEFPASMTSALGDIPGVNLPDLLVSVQIGVLYSSNGVWLETDIESAKNDINSVEPNQDEWGNPNVGYPIFISFPLPMGGSLMICSDPSIFINEYLSSDYNQETVPGNEHTQTTYSDFDNNEFAENVVNYMMEERDGQTVIFDESHLANHPLSPIFPLSLYFKFLDMITMFPLISWTLPIIVLSLSRRFMPKRSQAKPLLITKVQRYYGRSFFAVKMRWFLEYKQFSRGLELIYRKLLRAANRRYSPSSDLTPELLANYLVNEFPNNFNYKELTTGLTKLEQMIKSRIEITEDEFLSYYLFIKEISSMF